MSKRARGKGGKRRGRKREKKRRREWTSSSESSETYSESPVAVLIMPSSHLTFGSLTYLFNVFLSPEDEKLCFVAKEVLKDGLGMKGFRSAMQDIPRSEKFHKKVGPGNKKLCISEDGLAMILQKSRSDNRAELIRYLNVNYRVKIPLSRKEEGRSADDPAPEGDAIPKKDTWEKVESLIEGINDHLAKMDESMKNYQDEMNVLLVEAFAKAAESQDHRHGVPPSRRDHVCRGCTSKASSDRRSIL